MYLYMHINSFNFEYLNHIYVSTIFCSKIMSQ